MVMERTLTRRKIMITKTFALSQLTYFFFKFLWNKKWQGKCPDRIKRQILKKVYKDGGLKAPDISAIDNALKLKQYLNPIIMVRRAHI